jgi:hypothetical protein
MIKLATPGGTEQKPKGGPPGGSQKPGGTKKGK